VTAAEVNGREIVPLCQRLFSAEAQDFTSENAEASAAVDLIRAHTQGRGIWTIDHGGDRQKIQDAQDKTDEPRHGAEPIRLPGRFVKQSYNLEDIRVMKHQRLKNLLGSQNTVTRPLPDGRGSACRRVPRSEPRPSGSGSWGAEDCHCIRRGSVVLLVTAVAYFAATFPGQQMKLRILCEKLLIISQRLFGIPPFRFYALADGEPQDSFPSRLRWAGNSALQPATGVHSGLGGVRIPGKLLIKNMLTGSRFHVYYQRTASAQIGIPLTNYTHSERFANVIRWVK
jgi:hypothetical protein